MKKLLGPIALLLLCSLPAFAQDNKFEVGGGYTYRSFIPPTPGPDIPNPRVSYNGWNGSVAYHVNNWFSVATVVDGTYNSVADESGGNDKSSIYTVLVGPRVYPFGHHTIAPFGEALFGLAHIRTTLPSSTECGDFCTFTDGSFGVAVGGGVDLNLTKHVGIRAAEFDYERTSFVDLSTPGLSDASNNWKVSAGVFFRF
ncbi:MAG TPA: outer membrane beta-barrel protein [Verrucomicrobiae bacterium]|nr:outer membrane beta-barrel protein [Verrucomicrobiae bacterium]